MKVEILLRGLSWFEKLPVTVNMSVFTESWSDFFFSQKELFFIILVFSCAVNSQFNRLNLDNMGDHSVDIFEEANEEEEVPEVRILVEMAWYHFLSYDTY